MERGLTPHVQIVVALAIGEAPQCWRCESSNQCTPA
jgi:hypothetical protein